MSSTSAPPVIAEGLGYRFGKRTALTGVDLRVDSGKILGLVGPNGSGKTTLLKLFAGLLRPASGTLHILGYKPFQERERVMRQARFAFAPPALFEMLNAREHLRHLAHLSGAKPSKVEIDAALETVGLAARAKDRVRTYSLGMRQRLALAQALLPRPDLLVLDEPTDGLDPLGVLELRGVLKRLRDEQGVTIVLSSHLMVEVEELVDSLLVLMDGSVEFNGAPSELLRDGERLLLRVSGVEPHSLCERLAVHDANVSVVAGGELQLAVGALDLEQASRLVRAAGGALESFHVCKPDLQTALLERQRAKESQA